MQRAYIWCEQQQQLKEQEKKKSEQEQDEIEKIHELYAQKTLHALIIFSILYVPIMMLIITLLVRILLW